MTTIRTEFAITLLSLVALLSGCVEGRPTPEPTEMVTIDAGLFTFGSEEICYNERNVEGVSQVACADFNALFHTLKKVYPTRTVYIPKFAIDEHEVTNLQYEYCVAAGGCSEPDVYNLGSIYNYYRNKKYWDYPAINVRWDQANEYCEFVGKRLPTEYEWERAAAGPSVDGNGQQDASAKRTYPFEGHSDDISDCQDGDAAIVYCRGVDFTRAVATSDFDRVQEGDAWIYDLGGNVSEWVIDPWKAGVTCADELTGCTDCYTCTDSNCQYECRNCQACVDADDLCFRQCNLDPNYADNNPTDQETLLNDGVPVCIRYPDPPDYDTCTVEAGESTCGPSVAQDRGYRGGNIHTRDTDTCLIRATDRSGNLEPRQYNSTLGFRCARSLE